MIKVQENWGVLISQTGSEVIAIAKETGFLPSLLITNRLTKISPDNMRFFGENGVIIRTIPFKPTSKDYLFPELLEKKLITLHGFLRIVPPEFFSQYKGRIYNGHPALITRYPELKGFNKQEDIVGNQEKYPVCGSVIHEVIPELDSGKVIIAASIENTAKTVNEAYSILRNMSLLTWIEFFKNTWSFE
jgi:folate-dependent phosphoribosylglycinamide formyltransferase PurN